MDSSIIVALVSGVCVAVPSVIASITTSNANQKLTAYQIEEIKKEIELQRASHDTIVIHDQKITTLYKYKDNHEERISRLENKGEDNYD